MKDLDYHLNISTIKTLMLKLSKIWYYDVVCGLLGIGFTTLGMEHLEGSFKVHVGCTDMFEHMRLYHAQGY